MQQPRAEEASSPFVILQTCRSVRRLRGTAWPIAVNTGVRNAPRVYKQFPMTVIPIPPGDLKPHSWYYGVRCACARLLALAEDCFVGRGTDHLSHLCC